jgi:plastocyanin
MLRNRRWLLSALAVGAMAAACGGGSKSPSEPGTTPTPTAKTVMVTISDFQFTPKDVQINAGDTVVWMQGGTDPMHTVTAADGSFDSGAIFKTQGTTYQRTFTTGGVTVNYFCRAHYATYGMAGSIKVGSNAPPPNPGY